MSEWKSNGFEASIRIDEVSTIRHVGSAGDDVGWIFVVGNLAKDCGWLRNADVEKSVELIR